jgi:hypothetical protein
MATDGPVTPAPDPDGEDAAVAADGCCGQQIPAWKGKPHGNGCALCVNSPTYWRRSPGMAEQLAARQYGPALL